MFEVRLFGVTEVRTPAATLGARDFGGVKQRHILQLLALYGALSKAELAEHLWEGRPPAEYVATLESYVSLLRRRLDPAAPARHSVLVTRTGGYALDADRVGTDTGEFDRLVGAAAGLPAPVALPLLARAVDLAGAPLLARAVDLAGAPLLAGEDHRTWVVDARQRHRARLVAAATRAAEHGLALGDLRPADRFATHATELDPLAESAWRVRMSSHRAEGDRAGALRHYESCRRTLADELGIEPSAATQALFVTILRDDDPGIVAAVLAAARELAAGGSRDSGGAVVALLTRAKWLVRQAGVRDRRMSAAGTP